MSAASELHGTEEVFVTNRLDVLRATFFIAGRENEPSENRQRTFLKFPQAIIVIAKDSRLSGN